MVKLIAFLKRKPGMSIDELKVRWVEEHTKISGQLPNVRGYYINIATPQQLDGGDRFTMALLSYGGILSKIWKPHSKLKSVSLLVKMAMPSPPFAPISIPPNTPSSPSKAILKNIPNTLRDKMYSRAIISQ
jgi:hypothetical protein